MYVCALSRSFMSNSAAPWTVACQAPLSMELSRQENWSALPFPAPGLSSQPRDQTYVSYISCIGRQILYHCTTWEALIKYDMIGKYILPFSKLLFLFLYDGFLHYAEVFQFNLVPFVYFCFCFPCL